MRLSKTVDGVEHIYLYENGLLVQETRGSKIFDYSYDANGNIRMLKYRTSPTGSVTYVYYALNSRGDVIGLYNGSGSLFAKYNYDAWGNIISVTNASGVEVSDNHIAKLQPFRYRSYYYDADSGFYYLQSRYYDPVTHRFINADGLVSTGTGILGHNMFAYCNNNPVNYTDFSGCKPKSPYEMQLEIASGKSEYTIMDVTRMQMDGSNSTGTNTQNIGITVSYGTMKTTSGTYKGWNYYVHSENTATNTQRHIHIEKFGKKYAQNIDGTPHDGSTGEPPNSIKKKLKEEGVWDWNDNVAKQDPNYLLLKCAPEGSMSPCNPMLESMHNVYFLPVGLTVPTVSFSIAPTAVFPFVPAFII